MSYTQIKKTQLIKCDLDTIWDFISAPENLKKITPKSMLFHILSTSNKKMYPGMIIAYKVAPILRIPITWITEITHVKNRKYFVDEQRLGPYKMWHHEHILEETKEGILMTDIITYIPPLGIIGKAINFLFIKRKVNSIFDYRKKVLEEIFN